MARCLRLSAGGLQRVKCIMSQSVCAAQHRQSTHARTAFDSETHGDGGGEAKPPPAAQRSVKPYARTWETPKLHVQRILLAFASARATARKSVELTRPRARDVCCALLCVVCAAKRWVTRGEAEEGTNIHVCLSSAPGHKEAARMSDVLLVPSVMSPPHKRIAACAPQAR